ncbi:MAG TPA: hypothetical protein VNI02_00850, partial [Blastocatellia bacterium]|nr:hypothetical protein [Blastocatellia bacterium]
MFKISSRQVVSSAAMAIAVFVVALSSVAEVWARNPKPQWLSINIKSRYAIAAGAKRRAASTARGPKAPAAGAT